MVRLRIVFPMVFVEWAASYQLLPVLKLSSLKHLYTASA